MRRTLRWLAGLAAVLLVLVVAAAGVVVWSVRRSLPDYDATVAVPGLSSTVEVLRDDHGVPTVYADTAEDLFRAQGWLAAQDRFWQMDFRRHVTAGRLAELFGTSQVETDAFVRTMGWRRVAQQELALLSPSTRRYLRAYADGVNAWLRGRSGSALSVQHGILSVTNRSYVPEPWSPVDSLAWLKAMAWDLRSNMEQEIARVQLLQSLPRERVEQLYPRYPYAEHAPVVSAAELARSAAGPRARPVPTPAPAAAAAFARLGVRAGALDALIGQSGIGIGSNAWAVSGRLTASGRPLLANDPHLSPELPSTWTQVGLRCRTVSRDCPFDVAGYGFAGLPGVVIGHNARIAWGFTNLAPDVSDLYLEQVRPDDTYLTERGPVPLEQRQEVLRVAGGEDVRLTVRSTRHGPLLSDVSEEMRAVGRGAAPGGEYAVALQWTALTPGRTADALFAMPRATDFASFREAARGFEVPAQNLVYADVDGHVGYQAPGRIPIRTRGDGRWPVPGWTGQFEWRGAIPYDELPSMLDPEDGLVVTANQAVVPPTYPYLLTTDWNAGYRAQRIRDRLEEVGDAGRRLTADDMLDVQLDSQHPAAPALVPALLAIPDLDPEWAGQGQQVLRTWDGSQGVDSAGAAYFNAVWAQVLALTFDDDIAVEEARPDGGGRWALVVTALLDRPDDPFWDDRSTSDRRETRDDVLREALERARDDVTRLTAKEPAHWAWGRMHTLELEEPSFGTSGIGPIEALVNRGPFEVGGGSDAVEATSWNAREGFAVDTVPSMRMVVDLSDLDASRWVNLTGQSGHPSDPHFLDQVELWRTGRLTAMPWTRDAVRRGAAHTATLEPQGEPAPLPEAAAAAVEAATAPP